MNGDRSRSLAQIAIAFVLMHPGVTTVLGGFSDRAHVEEIASVSGGEGLSDAAMAELADLWQKGFSN